MVCLQVPFPYILLRRHYGDQSSLSARHKRVSCEPLVHTRAQSGLSLIGDSILGLQTDHNIRVAVAAVGANHHSDCHSSGQLNIPGCSNHC